MKKIRTLLSLALALLLTVTGAVAVNAGSVKSNALSAVGKKINKNQVSPTTNLDNIYLNENIVVAPSLISDDPEQSILNHDTYTIIYEDAIDYFDKTLSLKVEVTNVKVNNENHTFAPRNRIALINNLVHIYLNSTAPTDNGNAYGDGEYGYGDYASEATIKFTFLDAPNGNEATFTGLLGIKDIDGSHYKFNTSGRKIYYIDAYGDDKNFDNSAEKASDHFLVTGAGLMRDLNDPSGDDFTGSYDNASVYISLTEETSFTLTTQARSDEIIFPEFYTWNYKINYDANGGEGTMESEVFTNKNAEFLSKENEFTRKGYKFIGFSVDTPDYNDESELVKTPTDYKDYLVAKGEFAEMTLYAQWEPIKYDVLYDPNRPEGTKVGEGNVDVDDQLGLEYDENYNIRYNTYTTEGYKFVGWNDKADNNGTPYDENEGFKNLTDEDGGTITIYAQWEPIEYNVLYDPNRPDGAKAGEDNVNVEDQLNLKYDENYNIRDNTFTTVGYDFVGWNDKADDTGKKYEEGEEFSNLVKEDGAEVTIYAQWEPWKYTIKYDPNGGEGTMDDQKYVYQDPTMNSKENEYTRKGYKFIGFLFDGKLYTSIEDFRDVLVGLGPNSEITLVAQWEKLPTVPYKAPTTGIDRR